MRIPEHIGVIPDGNRRWAKENGFSKEKGYKYGLKPGLKLFKLCQKYGVREITFYGFTMDNTKRATVQTKAFQKACVQAVEIMSRQDTSILVVGNQKTPLFPKKLTKYTPRKKFGSGETKVNFLINYGWQWDIEKLTEVKNFKRNNVLDYLNSSEISRVDLIIRWGYRRRLSGFLPLQSVYADIYVVDDYWPNFEKKHFENALKWYDEQDLTYGG
ncbi:MAG: undecaprenyl diphosphate synthase family protein [bacterium]